MPVIQCVPASFNKELLEGLHNFKATGGSTFKLALYSDQANLGFSTTAYTTTGEVVGTGYTAGGKALTNVGTAAYGTTGYASFSEVSWTSSSITAMGGMIYNSSAAGNPVVCILNFGMNRSSVSGTFTVTFPTNNAQSAIIRINAPAA